MFTSCGTKSEESSLAEEFSAKLDAGLYDISMSIDSPEDGEYDCRIACCGGNGLVEMDKDGIVSEFRNVDEHTYMLLPEVHCYRKLDTFGNFGNAFIKLGEGDKLDNISKTNGHIIESYKTALDEEFVFEFDEQTKQLLKVTQSQPQTTVQINSVSWDCEDITLPDLNEWSDVSDDAEISGETAAKFLLYTNWGVSEEDVDAAGESYSDLAKLDNDGLQKAAERIKSNVSSD